MKSKRTKAVASRESFAVTSIGSTARPSARPARKCRESWSTHRGFRKTNIRLHHLINTLERRNLDLARINRELNREIIQRKRTEKALRESENHLRELFDEAHRMEENLRSLSNQILNAQEEERKHVSRELHDDVGQSLVGVSMALASMSHGTTDKKGDMEDKLREAQHLLEQAMKTVHDFARELRPATLDQLGLLPALRAYLDEFSKRTGLRIEFKGDPAAEDLGGEQRIVLYRIAQESLTNVAKHAHATSVRVTLQKARDGIRMEVADDGRSFREKPGKDRAGTRRLGLLGMRERARLVNGTFEVRPCPGKGTTTCTMVPFALPRGMSLPDQPGNGRRTNGHPARRRSRAALKTAVKRRSLRERN